jgi:hypothetical protein
MVVFYPLFSQKNNQAGVILGYAIGTDAPLGYRHYQFSQAAAFALQLFLLIASTDSQGSVCLEN